jgi:hypothetical protein
MVYPELNLVVVINSGPNSFGPIVRSVLDMVVGNVNKSN